MSAKKGVDLKDVDLGVDAWNVADGYAKLKILRPLIFLNKYNKIAKFGVEDLGEDLEYTNDQLKKRRVTALEMFVATLKELIEDTSFAIKKGDQEKVEKMYERVLMVEEFLPQIYSVNEDNVDHSEIFNINEKLFKSIHWILMEIKRDINVPLNNAGLIFRASEEVDLDKIMNEIIEGG